MGTQLRFSTTHYLHCYVMDNPKNCWNCSLGLNCLTLYSYFHSSIDMTTFQALYGQIPPPIKATTNHDIQDWFLQCHDILPNLRCNLEHTQQKMKALADKHRRDIQFNERGMIFKKLQPYRQNSLRSEQYNKLNKQYFGPFWIQERIGLVAYKLDLPLQSWIHPVFRASRLKLYKENNELHPTPQLLNDYLSHSVLQPQNILATRELL